MSATLDRIRAQRAILAAREGDGGRARSLAEGLSGEPRRLVNEALEMEEALGSLFGFYSAKRPHASLEQVEEWADRHAEWFARAVLKSDTGD